MDINSPRFTDEQTARTAHEVSRAFAAGIGDPVITPWDELPDEVRAGVISGVTYLREHKLDGAPAIHARWRAYRLETGWAYGPFKDNEKKEHPLLVPWDMLHPLQRSKDYLFVIVVRAMTDANATDGVMQAPPATEESDDVPSPSANG